MFTKNIKDTFTANLLNAVSGVLGEANKKKCSEGCECEACVPEEETNENYVSHAQRKAVWANRADDGKGHPDKKKKMKEEAEVEEGYIPTQRNLTARDNKTVGKLAALMKKEREAKEKKEPNGVKTEEVEDLDEKRGLWDNIHAKRERIKRGSGERMRKPGSEGAPSAQDFKDSQKESVELEENQQYIELTNAHHGGKSYIPVHPTQAYAALNHYNSFSHNKRVRIIDQKQHDAIHAAKTPVKEELDFNEAFEQIDEISKAMAGRYINKAKNSIDLTAWRQGYKEAGAGTASKQMEKKLSKRHKGIETAVKKLTKEESEQIDEANGGYHVMGKYTSVSWHPTEDEAKTHAKKLNMRGGQHYTVKKGESRRMGEDVEQIDELSKATMGRYINKAATKMGSQGVTAGLKIAADEKSSKNFKDMGKREKGIKLAVNKLTKEEQDFIDSLNDADIEQIDELSKGTLGSYVKKASGAEQPKNVMSPKNVPLTKIAAYQGDSETGHFGSRFNQATYDKAERLRKNRSQGITRAADKLAKEEVELDEARGRPKKAGAKDFTIHPRTKEKLMHDNPAHMKKIELLQKNRILDKPKIEAGQNIMTQLQKAKTSMTGGTKIHFTHGDSTEVSGTHAARLLDKHAGMKPAEKEAFQKKIGHSHANLKSEL